MKRADFLTLSASAMASITLQRLPFIQPDIEPTNFFDRIQTKTGELLALCSVYINYDTVLENKEEPLVEISFKKLGDEVVKKDANGNAVTDSTGTVVYETPTVAETKYSYKLTQVYKENNIYKGLLIRENESHTPSGLQSIPLENELQFFDDQVKIGISGYAAYFSHDEFETDYSFSAESSAVGAADAFLWFGDGGGGCFITTAAVRSKNLPDDCYELQTLRHFRDTYMRTFPEGKELIQDYYRIGPELVQSLENQPNAQGIFDHIYEDMILTSIQLIKQGNLEKAMNFYKEYSLGLRKKLHHS